MNEKSPFLVRAHDFSRRGHGQRHDRVLRRFGRLLQAPRATTRQTCGWPARCRRCPQTSRIAPSPASRRCIGSSAANRSAPAPSRRPGWRGEAYGNIAFSSCCASSGIGATSSPAAEASSGHLNAESARQREDPQRIRCRVDAAGTGVGDVEMLRCGSLARQTPYCRSTASNTASEPASAAVCDCTACAPTSDRPTFMNTIALRRSRAISRAAMKTWWFRMPSA